MLYPNQGQRLKENTMNTQIYKYFDQALGLDRFNFAFLDAVQNTVTYPRHNIIRHKDGSYTVEVCIPGWEKKDISIVRSKGVLRIEGAVSDKEVTTSEYLHHGISTKAFKKPLAISDDLQIHGNATLENGILSIHLKSIQLTEELDEEIAIS